MALLRRRSHNDTADDKKRSFSHVTLGFLESMEHNQSSSQCTLRPQCLAINNCRIQQSTATLDNTSKTTAAFGFIFQFYTNSYSPLCFSSPCYLCHCSCSFSSSCLGVRWSNWRQQSTIQFCWVSCAPPRCWLVKFEWFDWLDRLDLFDSREISWGLVTFRTSLFRGCNTRSCFIIGGLPVILSPYKCRNPSRFCWFD